MKSEVIIFDEPTASLDPVNSAMFEEVLLKLGEEGKTILVSTHDIDFVYGWAERILVFSKGNIIADGTPVEIFKNEEVIKAANLKRPLFFDMYEILLSKNIICDNNIYPKNINEFKALLDN